MVDLKEAFSTLRFGSYSATYFALQWAQVGSWLYHKQTVDHYFFCLIQLLTFDTSDSGDAPPTTCLHLLYKQGERRGPQVMSVTGSTQTHNTLTVKHSHRVCQASPQSILLVLLVQGGKGRLSTMPRKAEIQVDLGPVHCELDISIVDRLNSLLQPQKLATTELIASHLYTSYNKHVSLVSVPKTSNENAIKHLKSL